MRFKRRKKPGSSKNEKKVQRRAHEARGWSDGTVLRHIYPGVSGLSIEFSITSPQDAIAFEETRRFSPLDATDFSCECPGTCGEGAFDVSEKLGSMITAQERQGEASGTCHMESFGGIPKPCGYILKCRIEIAY